MRPAAAMLVALIALGAMQPPAAGAQTARFKGWPAIERELSTRLAPKDKPLDLYQFIPGDDMDDLLGTWFTVGSEHAFHNGTPNSVNMVIWHVALSGFAKSLGESCAKPRFVFHPHFAEVLRRMCVWPAESARSEQAMADFWLSVMGYNAPESEFRAWRDFFLQPAYRTRSASDTIAAMTLAITMNPYFLLNK